MTNFKIVQHKNIWLTISAIIFVVAAAGLIMWSLKFGIDFTGGSLLEVKFSGERPTVTQVEEKLGAEGLGSLTVQPVGENGVILRFQNPEKEKADAVMKKLEELAGAGSQAAKPNVQIQAENKALGAVQIETSGANTVEQIRYTSVGPSIGKELKQKAIYAIFWVLAAIVVYISIAFRRISKPVASWKYGLSALIAMIHDVIITIGVFAILGHFYGIEINTPFVAAVLTVLGYSIHDTIVVFDRIRENLPRSDEDFEGTVNTSLNQTLVRSLNTSLTVILTLLAVLIFGGASIRTFALALTIGIFIGTYSSIFVASPMLVLWEKWGKS
ncbi:MAG: protein translocase subunit SecF [Patescibacteria group bacterium]|jgi:preprotein translocase subunit SecF